MELLLQLTVVDYTMEADMNRNTEMDDKNKGIMKCHSPCVYAGKAFSLVSLLPS